MRAGREEDLQRHLSRRHLRVITIDPSLSLRMDAVTHEGRQDRSLYIRSFCPVCVRLIYRTLLAHFAFVCTDCSQLQAGIDSSKRSGANRRR